MPHGQPFAPKGAVYLRYRLGGELDGVEGRDRVEAVRGEWERLQIALAQTGAREPLARRSVPSAPRRARPRPASRNVTSRSASPLRSLSLPAVGAGGIAAMIAGQPEEPDRVLRPVGEVEAQLMSLARHAVGVDRDLA
jgi:hypothetical protein